jgi:hypothetical protein
MNLMPKQTKYLAMITLLMLLEKLSTLFTQRKSISSKSTLIVNDSSQLQGVDDEQKLEVLIELAYGNDFQKSEQMTMQSVEELVIKQHDCIIGAEKHWHFHSFGRNSVIFTMMVYLKKGANHAIARAIFSEKLGNTYMKNKLVDAHLSLLPR